MLDQDQAGYDSASEAVEVGNGMPGQCADSVVYCLVPVELVSSFVSARSQRSEGGKGLTKT